MPAMNCASGSPRRHRRLQAGSATYIMVGDGWIKDGDYNTVFSKTVLPLPYHAMKDYTVQTGHVSKTIRLTGCTRPTGKIIIPVT